MTQELLSAFGGGDTDCLRLSLESLGERKRVEDYIESLDCGGWDLALVSEGMIWWHDASGSSAKTFKIEPSEHGWNGSRRNRSVPPHNTRDLQTALDRAAEWLREHPLESANGTGGDDR
ncbi:hypothetical protein [Natronorubrum sp. FCH18a]|uniref:hypothetical protein n=1 Tax=Natronorubrum sp. FCH18a TaxID=3447018 RepID=UPI003F51025D